MLQAANISTSTMRRSVLIYGTLCCILYILFLLLMKLLNLVEASGFRMINFFILWLVTFVMLKRWIKRSGNYIPFLQVYSLVFFTGTFSFILFAGFLFFYSYYDPLMSALLLKHSKGAILSVPSIIVLFEGAGASIIIALINMVYFTRYEEEDFKPGKKRKRPSF